MPTTRLKKKHLKTNFVSKLRKSILFSDKDGVTPTTPNITETMPFNFNEFIKRHGKVQASILPKFIVVCKKEYGKRSLSQFYRT